MDSEPAHSPRMNRTEPSTERRPWAPAAVAGALALVLVWLSADPLALRPQDVEPGGPLWWGGDLFLRVPKIVLHEPRGDLAKFPRRFRWSAVDGADSYEVLFGEDRRGSPPLARTRRSGTFLDLAFEDSSATPGYGDYVWDVRARRGEEILARGLARFRVTTAAESAGVAPVGP